MFLRWDHSIPSPLDCNNYRGNQRLMNYPLTIGVLGRDSSSRALFQHHHPVLIRDPFESLGIVVNQRIYFRHGNFFQSRNAW